MWQRAYWTRKERQAEQSNLTHVLRWGKLAAMQTLGLSGETNRRDGWLRSIFWPTVENAWDVDYLGQQGFWICVLIAAFQLGFALLTGSMLLIALGLPTALLYFSGGMGVREKSWPAAALICACYLVETLLSVMTGLLLSPMGALKIVFLALLVSNLRATFIASEWKPAAEGEDSPQRFNETWRDKLVDSLPPRLWPLAKIPFYGLGALWLLFSLLALAGVLLMRLGFLPMRGH